MLQRALEIEPRDIQNLCAYARVLKVCVYVCVCVCVYLFLCLCLFACALVLEMSLLQ